MKQIASCIVDNQEIKVVDDKGIRYMAVGDLGCHSAIYMDPQKIYQPFFRKLQEEIEKHADFTPIHNAKRSGPRALVLGAGGCSIPRFLALRYRGSIHIDVIDIESRILSLCQEYFLDGIDASSISLHEHDGFQFVKDISGPDVSCTNQYDFIFVDMYVNDQIAGSPFSDTFLDALKQILSPGGMLAINAYPYESQPELEDLLAKMKGHFPQAGLITDTEECSNIIMAS